MTHALPLPAGVSVFERGWLSANNILLVGDGPSTLIDSGYCTHAEQTLALVSRALGERPLDLLVNTHLHSDHCGGNAALQARYPAARTLVPPGHAQQVRDWDPVALTYEPTGQLCPRFRLDAALVPGSMLAMGAQSWEVHAAPGHDPHSVILFEPASRTLVSADALWESGFGVVFPELEGESAFAEVGQTLDLIESLAPRVVIPGHGPVFTDVTGALATARKRLRGFEEDPARHARYAAKVLLKYKLLELKRFTQDELRGWADRTRYLGLVRERWAPGIEPSAWLDQVVDELAASGALRREGTDIVDA
ncbi:MBL fold metallo-hydrolase [Ramlibacter sp. MAHUQ-53]|uniref:MBL fold metallo-hydrolase n=1 Tax=unclassified Ramlibacter TaxID=2617605 RepID=UPI003636EAF3